MPLIVHDLIDWANSRKCEPVNFWANFWCFSVFRADHDSKSPGDDSRKLETDRYIEYFVLLIIIFCFCFVSVELHRPTSARHRV